MADIETIKGKLMESLGGGHALVKHLVGPEKKALGPKTLKYLEDLKQNLQVSVEEIATMDFAE